MSEHEQPDTSQPAEDEMAPPIVRSVPITESSSAPFAQQQVSLTQLWIGQLPPPEILIRYNQIAPDAAERIIHLLEEQTHHRLHEEALQSQHQREMESSALELTRESMQADMRITERSQHYGLGILILDILAGLIIAVVALLNHSDPGAIVGALLSGGGLAALAAVFFRRGESGQREVNVADAVQRIEPADQRHNRS